MDIRRMQVEGGVLDGFDVTFSRGLNVLIGARGTGKTSSIELIRFAPGGPQPHRRGRAEIGGSRGGRA